MKSENRKISNIMENKKFRQKLPLDNPIYNKDTFEEFCELEIDWSVKSINKEDLPDEVSGEVCEFISMFRRMTVHEKTEWNFYIDYKNNEIIHCLHGGETNVKDWINSGLMKNRKILSIHNHPQGTYSAPSPANFEILGQEFENYEIICAEEEFWILEAKGYFKTKNDIKSEINEIFNTILTHPYKIQNQVYSEKLKNYINNLNQEINISNKEYR